MGAWMSCISTRYISEKVVLDTFGEKWDGREEVLMDLWGTLKDMHLWNLPTRFKLLKQKDFAGNDTKKKEKTKTCSFSILIINQIFLTIIHEAMKTILNWNMILKMYSFHCFMNSIMQNCCSCIQIVPKNLALSTYFHKMHCKLHTLKK